MSASNTFSETLTFSAAAMYDSRERADSEPRGVKRNFEQRDAIGSIILEQLLGAKPCIVKEHTWSHNCIQDKSA